MPQGTRCLVVDDDPDVRRDLAAYLRGFGFETTPLADGTALRRHLASAGAEVVVLDVMLPGEDGLSLLRWLQAEHPALPVLMLTARGDATSRVVGLELGADDYLAKPFEPRELVARLQAVLRRLARPAQAGARHVRFEGWQLDRVLRELQSPEQVTLPLSAAEFRLLSVFVERPGRVLGRELLLELTRAGGLDVSDRSIDLAVSRLRAKLRDGDRDSLREPRLIRTVRGEGYLFDARVEEG